MTNNKSAMEQMIDWLENQRVVNYANEHYPYSLVVIKARSLLAAEQSLKENAEAGLRPGIMESIKALREGEYITLGVCNGLLSLHPTPTENKGGEEGLEEIWRDIYQRLLDGEYSYKQIDAVRNVMDEVLRRHRPASPTKADKVESLAELADRKGYSFAIGYDTACKYFSQCFEPGFMDEEPTFHCDMQGTYAEAEAKCRAFLTALDDVTGKGGRDNRGGR